MLARPVFRNLRKHWAGILLAFLAISSTGFGIARWEASQTFNGLSIYCASSRVTQYANASLTQPTYGAFVVSIGFKNPNLFPVAVYWIATPILNGSAYFGGSLQDNIPGFSSHLAQMQFRFIPPELLTGNQLLSRVISYERYSILGDIFAEPRIFFIPSDQTILLRPDNLMNLMANRIPGILWSVFIQHSNLLESQGLPSC
jgi:hypothetical protein